MASIFSMVAIASYSFYTLLSMAAIVFYGFYILYGRYSLLFYIILCALSLGQQRRGFFMPVHFFLAKSLVG